MEAIDYQKIVFEIRGDHERSGEHAAERPR